MINEQEIIKKHYRKLGKLSHEKSPRDPEYYREIQKKSVDKRQQNKQLHDIKKLSTRPPKK